MVDYKDLIPDLDIGPFTREPSLIRDDESQYEHGKSAPGYNAEALRLSQQAATTHEKAILDLRAALDNQAEVTPQQGLAAALLATIPMLGGYMIGKSVGKAKIPEGVYFPGMKPAEFNEAFGGSGAMAGGAAGAKLGQEVSNDYFKRMQNAIDKRIPIQKEIGLQGLKEADRLAGEASQMKRAGLAQEATAERDRTFRDFNDRQRQLRTQDEKDLFDYKKRGEAPPAGYTEAMQALALGKATDQQKALLATDKDGRDALKNFGDLKERIESGDKLDVSTNQAYLGTKQTERGLNTITNLFEQVKKNPQAASAVTSAVDSFKSEIDPKTGNLKNGANLGAYLIAKTKLDPNSPLGIYFIEAERIGRANAIAQRGVATDQDVLQEIRNLVIQPLESSDIYLGRLSNQREAAVSSREELLRLAAAQGQASASNLLKDDASILELQERRELAALKAKQKG